MNRPIDLLSASISAARRRHARLDKPEQARADIATAESYGRLAYGNGRPIGSSGYRRPDKIAAFKRGWLLAEQENAALIARRTMTEEERHKGLAWIHTIQGLLHEPLKKT